MAGYAFDQRSGVMLGTGGTTRPTYGGYQPPRPTAAAPRPVQPQPAPAPQPTGMGGATSSYSYSSRPSGGSTAPMTFSPTALNRPQRVAVNDPGYFGGQAGAVNARLGQLLDPSYQTVRDTDADVSPLMQSIDRNSVQSARGMQAAAAERAAAEGTLQGGGFSSTAQQINEQARAQAGDAKAQLMWDKNRERQNQIQQAMQLGGSLIDSQSGRNLQRELADLQNEQVFNDQSLRRDLGFGDLNLRSQLGNRDMDIRSELGRGQLDLGWADNALRGELGRGGLDLQRTGMNMQNNQFYDRLGFDRSAFESTMNRQIANDLMGY